MTLCVSGRWVFALTCHGDSAFVFLPLQPHLRSIGQCDAQSQRAAAVRRVAGFPQLTTASIFSLSRIRDVGPAPLPVALPSRVRPMPSPWLFGDGYDQQAIELR